MTANKVRENPAARHLAQAVLRELLPEQLHREGLTDTVEGSLGVLPLYSIPLKRLVRNELTHGWRWGWIYFWVGPNELGTIVEVRRKTRTEATFSSFSFGKRAGQIANTLANAQLVVDRSPIRFRPRLLRLPAIHMEAVWLNSDPVDEPEHFFGLSPKINGASFLAKAQKRAKHILEV